MWNLDERFNNNKENKIKNPETVQQEQSLNLINQSQTSWYPVYASLPTLARLLVHISNSFNYTKQ